MEMSEEVNSEMCEEVSGEMSEEVNNEMCEEVSGES